MVLLLIAVFLFSPMLTVMAATPMLVVENEQSLATGFDGEAVTAESTPAATSGDVEDADTAAAAKAITAAGGEAVQTRTADAGNATDPIIIKTADELIAFRNAVNVDKNDYAGAYVQLGADIDLAGIGNWEPIGRHTGPSSNANTNYGTWFAGTFDGAGYEIKNLTIGTQENPAGYTYAGLFGVVAPTAVIKNLGITNVAIYNVSDPAAYSGDAGTVRGHAAAIVAQTQGSATEFEDNGVCTVIDNCYVNGGSIYSETKNSNIAYAGGIAAELKYGGAVTNSRTDVTVSAVACSEAGTSAAYAGGLYATGGNYCLTMNSYALGDVASTSANSGSGAVAGGLAGLPAGVVYNCYAAGNIAVNQVGAAAAAYASAGALFGWMTANGVAVNCNYDPGASVICYTKINDTTVDVNNDYTGKIAGYGAANGWCYNTTELSGESLAAQLNQNLSRSAISAAQNYIDERYANRDADKNNTETGKRYVGTRYAFDGMVNAVDGYYEWTAAENKAVLSDKYWASGEIDGSIFASGSGTEADPYRIKNEEQLRAFAVSLTEKIDYNGIFVALDNDITLSGGDWTPVGEGEYAFQGTFDGGGHTISGLTVGKKEAPTEDNGTTLFYGLFGVLGSDATVKEVAIAAAIYVTSDISIYSGGIVGYNDGGVIDGCRVAGEIISQSPVEGNNFTGGIVGYDNSGIIVNSGTDVNVRSEAKSYIAEAGGIVGIAQFSTILNCYALGGVSGYASRSGGDEGMVAAGGIAGVQAGTVANAYAFGDTASDTYSLYVGALHGWATGISRSFLGYYNTDSAQTIDGKAVSPVNAIGWIVGGGKNEEGIPYDGGVVYGNQGYAANDMKSAAFAKALNDNFAAFPVDVATVLPEDVTLKTWTYSEESGLVTPGGTDATVVYEAPDIEEGLAPDLYDGTYQGRDGDDYIVSLVVENNKIASIGLPGTASEELTALVNTVIAQQKAVEVDYDNDSEALQTAKLAIIAALAKAAVNDETGYGPVDPAIFAGGTGSREDPFQIATAEQLLAFAAAVNEDESFAGYSIALSGDIDLSGHDWVPAGGNGPWPFSGYFDGNNHEIRHLSTGSEEDPAFVISSGLFANITGGTVVNTGITDAEIYLVCNTDERIYGGILSGYVYLGGSDGYIDNCWATGALTNIADSWSYAGGLIGSVNHGTITNSWTDVTVYSKSDSLWSYAGGLVAMTARTGLFNNYAHGAVTSSGFVNRSLLGGIAAMHAGAGFNNYADVDLTALVATGDVGGFAGRHTGIAYAERNYFNAAALQKAGDTVITETKGIGAAVTGDREGQGVAEEILGLPEAEFHSAALADKLNANLDDAEILPRLQAVMDHWAVASYPVAIPDEVTLFDWKYDSEARRVVFVQPGEEDPDEPNTHVFTDVAAGDWFNDAVAYVYTKGLMLGTSSTKFSPLETMNRGMIVTMLYRLEGEPGGGGYNFSDVPGGVWYSDAVAWAADKGIVNGYGEGRFGPEDRLTREQSAEILYRYAKYKGYDVSAAADFSGFSDGGKVSAWANESMRWAVGAGLLKGKGNGILDPNGFILRAEAATVFERLLETAAQ